MTVSQILGHKGRKVVTIAPDHTLAEAIDLLYAKRIGAVVVTNGKLEVLGIFSERDVVRVVSTAGASALSDPVSAHMTKQVRTCSEATTVDAVMAMMTDGKFRHVPVVDDGRLVGLVSIGDVVKQRLSQIESEREALREYIAGA
jgi:CBS domain-containing protein